MRLLGVDFGFKRIGIAVAETEPCIITARATIEASGKLATDAQRLVEMARKEEGDAGVLDDASGSFATKGLGAAPAVGAVS